MRRVLLLAALCAVMGGVCGESGGTANNHGFIPWKNRCIRVSRAAAGESFEFGGESGFAAVAPYTRRSTSPTPGFIEALVGL